ncbi:MAG: hypothetical protein ACK4NX_02650 [Candidatus Paceibacteria bacterium]
MKLVMLYGFMPISNREQREILKDFLKKHGVEKIEILKIDPFGRLVTDSSGRPVYIKHLTRGGLKKKSISFN